MSREERRTYTRGHIRSERASPTNMTHAGLSAHDRARSRLTGAPWRRAQGTEERDGQTPATEKYRQSHRTLEIQPRMKEGA